MIYDKCLACLTKQQVYICIYLFTSVREFDGQEPVEQDQSERMNELLDAEILPVEEEVSRLRALRVENLRESS